MQTEQTDLAEMEENQSRNVKAPVSTDKDVSEKSSRVVTEGHPLMNVVILDNIIRHLDYEYLKDIRLVCQRWNDVTKNIFWKLSRIKVSLIDYDDYDEELLDNESEEHALKLAVQKQKLTVYFEKAFPSPAELPTNTIIFEGCINQRALEYFWKERGRSTLTSVYFQSFYEPTKGCIDLNQYITPKLTTLNISSLNHKFKVSLKMLADIQNLKLFQCEILLDGKIVPRELDLTLCSVMCEGNLFKPGFYRNANSQKILINDFVDFSKIKKLILRNNFWRFDVGTDTTELAYLSLKHVELVGLENSQWKTNFAGIGSCKCIGNKLEIKAIPAVIDTNYVEIESLPKTIEHLWFGIGDSFSVLPQPMICAYPNLKSLTIRIKRTRDFRILDFTNCTSLVDFQLSVLLGMYQMDFDRIKLPNSIKNMKFRNVIINTDAPWQLDTLFLYKYPFSAVEGALRHFTTTKLVIEFDTKLESEDPMIIVNHWRNSNIEQLAFGYSYVDGMERHFLFIHKNSIGEMEIIDWKSFKKLSSLNVHKDLLPFMESF